jgi:hypothetical protein
MTEPEPEDHAVSESGGTMRRLSMPPSDAVPDLGLLSSLRRVLEPGDLRPSGAPPYFRPGDVVAWHYGASVDLLRVVRDDDRGLVAWLPAGSERIAASARDGRGLRDRSLQERAALAVAGDYDLRVASWWGSGLLRIAPTGRPWSVWYFRDDDGTFEGHYLNLELPHERPVDGSPRVHTRDLILDVWVGDGGTWLKDADELAAGVAARWCTAEQAEVIHAAAETARREQIDPRAWPLDEGWEDWQPPPVWDEPLRLPDEVLEAVSKAGLAVRRQGND